MNPSPSPSLSSPTDLLAELLAALPKTEPKPRVSRARKPANAVDTRPLHQSFAIRKTGYVTWKAVSRIIQIQPQICKCCGGETEAVKGEFFALENGTAHATWLRAEAYGIEAPEDLPNIYSDLDPIYVTGCAQCRSTPFDDLEALFHPKQLSLTL